MGSGLVVYRCLIPAGYVPRLSECLLFCREAEATRNALHGVQWPIGNGKKLIIDYSTPEDMEVAQNPPAPPVPVPVAETKLPDKENEVCLVCWVLLREYASYCVFCRCPFLSKGLKMIERKTEETREGRMHK